MLRGELGSLVSQFRSLSERLGGRLEDFAQEDERRRKEGKSQRTHPSVYILMNPAG